MVSSSRMATAQRAAENRRAAVRKDRQRKQVAPANVITAQICQLTNRQPADVCAGTAVMSAAPLLDE